MVTAALLSANRSPAILLPWESVPVNVNTGIPNTPLVLFAYLLFPAEQGGVGKNYLRCGVAAVTFVACTPRLIMSCNSSGMEERAKAVSSVMAFWK
jgi:hypothetical protein